MVKNKNDKRYLRTKERMEQNYLREIRRQRGMAGVKSQGIYRGAGVHASTFLRHYRNLKGMVADVRMDIRKDYTLALRRIVRHGGGIRDVVMMTMDVMKRHQDYFVTVVEVGNGVVFEWIGRKIWNNFKKTNYHYGMERIEEVYKMEVIGVLVAWVREEHLDMAKAEQYAGYIVKLSENCSQRLSFLADKE